MCDYKQVKELFEIKFNELEKRIDEKFDSFDKRTDRIIESQNGKNKMLDGRITSVDKLHQKQADLHCNEIKAVKEAQGEIKTRLSVATTKLAVIISGIIFAVVFAFDRVASWFDHILTK